MDENKTLTPIRILLVDDHNLMRRGLKGLFALNPDYEVIGEATDGLQAIELQEQLKPDIILMDIDLPLLDGISATQRIKRDDTATKILALSAYDHDTQVLGMLASGADGYCLKNIEWEELLVIIRLISHGGVYLDPRIAHKVSHLLKSGSFAVETNTTPKAVTVLSERERLILKLIAEGFSNKKIAEQLFLSPGTIKSYVRMLLNKLSVDDRVQAAAKAVREGLI